MYRGGCGTGSCSAYPFFERPILTTGSGAHVEVLDGGYCANNPTLYAIADATEAMEFPRDALRVVSIGVGEYPDPTGLRLTWFLKRIWTVRLLQKTLDINTASMEQLRSVLFSDVPTVRINDTFDRPEMATDLMEYDLEKLDVLYQEGSESFATHELKLAQILKAKLIPRVS